jgi:DNA adenine methylase
VRVCDGVTDRMSTELQEKITRPVLRYHGGKFLLAPWIISNLPTHRVYTEAFGGAASVLLQKPRAEAEVYNDLNGDLVNLFAVLRERESAAELLRVLELTPYAYAEYKLSQEISVDPIERARRLLVGSFMSVGTDSTTRGGAAGFRNYSKVASIGSIPAQQWATLPGAIPAVVARLQGVILENRDALHVIRQHDSAYTLHYVDPPYPHSTRGRGRGKYAFELSDEQHRELADELKRCRGMVVLSGYACDLYDVELYAGWRRVERPTLADGARPRVEVLWMNAAAREALSPQAALF